MRDLQRDHRREPVGVGVRGDLDVNCGLGLQQPERRLAHHLGEMHKALLASIGAHPAGTRHGVVVQHRSGLPALLGRRVLRRPLGRPLPHPRELLGRADLARDALELAGHGPPNRLKVTPGICAERLERDRVVLDRPDPIATRAGDLACEERLDGGEELATTGRYRDLVVGERAVGADDPGVDVVHATLPGVGKVALPPDRNGENELLAGSEIDGLATEDRVDLGVGRGVDGDPKLDRVEHRARGELGRGVGPPHDRVFLRVRGRNHHTTERQLAIHLFFLLAVEGSFKLPC